MKSDDQSINEDIEDLNDLISYFNSLVALSEGQIPSDIVSTVVAIFHKTSDIMNRCLELNKETNHQLDESIQVCLSLADEIRKLSDENEKLHKFAEAASKFPGFNC